MNTTAKPTTNAQPVTQPCVDIPAPAPVLERVLVTSWLTIRPASVEDTDATWKFRQLDEVGNWLTGTPSDLEGTDGYRALFADPARLATTVIVQLGHDLDAPLLGTSCSAAKTRGLSSTSPTKLAERKPNSDGSSTLTTPATGMPPRRSKSCSGTASRTWESDG